MPCGFVGNITRQCDQEAVIGEEVVEEGKGVKEKTDSLRFSPLRWIFSIIFSFDSYDFIIFVVLVLNVVSIALMHWSAEVKTMQKKLTSLCGFSGSPKPERDNAVAAEVESRKTKIKTPFCNVDLILLGIVFFTLYFV